MTKTLFYIIGRSGSGKDTVMKFLLDSLPKLQEMIYYTTRAMRPYESEGNPYHFVDVETFKRMEAEGEFVNVKSYDVWTADNQHSTDWYGYPYPGSKFTITSGPYLVYKKIEERLKGNEEYRVIPLYLTLEDEWTHLERILLREINSKGTPKVKEAIRRFRADATEYLTNDQALEMFGSSAVFFNDNSIDQTVMQMHEYILDIIMEEETNHEN